MKLLAAAALLALATTGFAAPAEDEADFRDWMVVCDNVRLCTALGFASGADGAGAGPFLWLQREGGAKAAPAVAVGLGWSEEADAIAVGASATLRVAGPKGGAAFAGRVVEEELGARLVRLSPADTARFVAALKDGDKVEVAAGGKTLGAVSLSGSSAALRWMDDRQGRAGTVTALVAKGAKPHTAPAPAAPVYGLAKPLGPEVETPVLPAALARREDVKACIEDQADPEGDFGKPQMRRLNQTEYLWSVPCGRGAYNFSALYIIAAKDGTAARSPGFGDGDMLVNGSMSDEGTVGAFAKGRGIGDCGVAEQWAWDGRRFNRTERLAMGGCYGVPMTLWPRYWTAIAK